jgi:hypothetical protein
MLIVNQLVGNADNILFSEKARDHACEPYLMLRDELKKNNIEFQALKEQNIKSIDCVIYWDVDSIPPTNLFKKIIYKIKMQKSLGSSRDLENEARRAGIKLKKILFLYEPSSVTDSNKILHLYDDFDLIFTWNNKIIDNKKYFKFFIPSSNLSGGIKYVDFYAKKLLVDISSNKHYRGSFNSSKFRFEEIRHFDQKYGDDFDLYGAGWNQNISLRDIFTLNFRKKFYNKIQNYKGACESKKDVLSHYRFVLCYENTFVENGFVSVKIFDAFRSGCVPVYMGAPNIASLIPQSCFIDRRNFLSSDDLYIYLKNLSEAEHKAYLKAAAEFMGSDDSKKFTAQYFVKNFINVFNHKFI